MAFNRYSPYAETSIGPRFIDHFVYRSIPSADTDYELEIGVKYNQRPGLLSKDLFGTSKLWWIFAQMNPDLIIDPTFDLVSGMKIIVPDRKRILELFG